MQSVVLRSGKLWIIEGKDVKFITLSSFVGSAPELKDDKTGNEMPFALAIHQPLASCDTYKMRQAYTRTCHHTITMLSVAAHHRHHHHFRNVIVESSLLVARLVLIVFFYPKLDFLESWPDNTGAN